MGWAIATFFLGVIVGVILTALCAAHKLLQER